MNQKAVLLLVVARLMEAHFPDLLFYPRRAVTARRRFINILSRIANRRTASLLTALSP